MKSKWVWVVLAVMMGAGAYAGMSLATPATGQTTTTLAKATFDDLDLRGDQTVTTIGKNGKPREGVWKARIKTRGGSDLYVVDNKFAPGGSTGWHSHPGPSIIFVVAGSVANYSTDSECAPQTYAAGSSLVDPGGSDEHMLRNEGSVTAETIAVQFIPVGATRRIDVPTTPDGCPS